MAASVDSEDERAAVQSSPSDSVLSSAEQRPLPPREQSLPESHIHNTSQGLKPSLSDSDVARFQSTESFESGIDQPAPTATSPGPSQRATRFSSRQSSTRSPDSPVLVLEKFTLYETKQRLYVVASNQSDSRYRVLKIDRTSPVGEALPLTEDGVIYSKSEVTDLLKMIEEGNRNSGGLVRAVPLFYGIIGKRNYRSSAIVLETNCCLCQKASPGLLLAGMPLLYGSVQLSP
jgi:hypothetical protein